jgi:hypothetical protein
MATNLDVITDAMRRMNIIHERETPSSTQGQQGLDLLNDMLADWEEDGIELGYYPQTSTSATIPVEDHALRGIKYNLALEFGAEYGLEPAPTLAERARMTKARLTKATSEEVETSFDHMPFGGSSVYDINTG